MCFPLLLLNSECSPIQSPQSQADGHQDRSFSAKGCLLKSFPSVAPLCPPHQTHLRTNECPQWKTICSPLGCIPLVTTQRTRNCTGLLNNAVQPASHPAVCHVSIVLNAEGAVRTQRTITDLLFNSKFVHFANSNLFWMGMNKNWALLSWPNYMIIIILLLQFYVA